MVEFQVTRATLLAHGPWEATWTIPGKDPAKTAQPVRLFPKPSRPVDSGTQAVIEEVFLSDRLTALKISTTGLPPGVDPDGSYEEGRLVLERSCVLLL